MKKFLFLFLLTIPCLLIAQEKQVPLDTHGKLNSIDISLEKKLKLFPEYAGFQDAKLFQLNDSSFMLEISYKPENQTMRARIPMNLTEVNELRVSITGKIRLKAPNSLTDQSGRTALLIVNTLVGAQYYGSTISALLSGDTYDYSIGVSLLTAGASFYIPYALTRNMEITQGQALMAIYGQTRGIAHGALLPVLFSSEPDYRLTLSLGMAGSIAEGILGYRWAKKENFSVGRAGAIGTFGDFGMGIGIGSAYTLGLLEGSAGSNLAALSILAGGAIGTYAGYRISRNDYYTEGDLFALQGAGMLGAYLPASLMYVLGAEDSPQLITLGATLGAAGGLYFGDRLALKQDFSSRQGVYIMLSQLAGGLTGMGLGFLIDSSDRSEFNQMGKSIALLTGLGWLAGYGIAVKNFSKEINKEDVKLSLNLQLNPLGLLNSSKGNASNMHMPLLMGSIRF